METENFDEKLIKAYIGEKAEKIYPSVKNGGINIWGLLFGTVYFVYRKMYLIAIIAIITSNIVTAIMPFLENHTGWIIGCLFCPLYKWDITRKLKKIKQNNPNASEEELLSIAAKQGGTSISAILIFLIIIFVLLVFSLVFGG